MKLLPALALAALLTTTLAGCGDEDQDDAAEARTVACRGYALDTVGDRAQAVEEMAAAADFGEWDNERLSLPVARLGAAAAKAGNVPDLAEADYAAFLALVAAARSADVMINPTGDEVDLKTAADELDAAALAVEKLCS